MIAMASAAALGALTWLLAEYFIHRFVGHRHAARNPFAVEHRRHHSVGHYFAPTPKKIAAALPVITVLALATSATVGLDLGLAYTAGFTAAYSAYEALHRTLHTRAPRTRYGRWARRHHFHHHFEDPRTNHGVTTPIGDWILGTGRPPAQIRVPERLAMPWLLDDAGNVAEAHASDYALVRLKREGAPAEGAA